MCVSVNKIPAERMHQFGCGFRLIVGYCTGSDPIEIGDLGFKVKVTVTENLSKNDEKKIAKNSIMNLFNNKSYNLIKHFIAVVLIPNMTIS